MINLITPLYRYDNIPIIYKNVLSLTNDFNWYLIEGSNKTGTYDISEILKDKRVHYYKIDTTYPFGHEQRNYFITGNTVCDDEWCYFLDDDNLLTPDLISELSDDSDFILFPQKAGLTEYVRLYPGKDKLGLGLNDIGNFLIKYKLLKNHKITFISERNADGHFGEEIKTEIKKYKFKFLENKYTRYNCLSNEII